MERHAGRAGAGRSQLFTVWMCRGGWSPPGSRCTLQPGSGSLNPFPAQERC